MYLSLFAGLFAVLTGTPRVHAQTITDGIMLSKQVLCAGAVYGHDAWDRYWEGDLNRRNGNLGTVTTQMVNFTGNYGLTSRINVIAMAPYVWTHASQGVLHGQSGMQDLTLAVKVNAFQAPIGHVGAVRLLGTIAGSLPLTDYSPDQMPLSLGSHSKTITPRLTMNFQGRTGLYINASGAYTFRDNVKLDRSVYYTNNQLFLTNQVALPNLFNDNFAVGYHRRDLVAVGIFEMQQSRGGGDIRMQDMPFVSNRMNYSRAGGMLQYPIPGRLHNVQYWLSYTNTFQGRNVGEGNTIATGVMYTFHFEGRGRKNDKQDN